MTDYSTAVAIVGMSGRFPGAHNIGEFWSILHNGVEAVTPLSDDELLAAGIDPALLNNPAYVKAARLLDDVDLFDAAFFGFTRREAEQHDPQHRIFMECAWEALDDAGYNAATFEGHVGVYAGSSVSTYVPAGDHTVHASDAVESLQLLLGNDKDYLATQLSYRLNLTGPSMAVQTACSTSLVAVCLASQALLTWQCDLALAGGATVRLPQKTGYLYQESGLFSPDGRCRPYDEQAAGVAFGSGCGVVALKRAEDAIAAGDRIYAVIRGWSVSNDGSRKVGFTAPGVEGQVQAITQAQAMAGVEPESIQYVEGHGTATLAGDAIEVSALRRVFGAVRKKNFCALGSVKANVGHLDAAAGVSSLIKTALALDNECVPPSPNFERPNPAFELEKSPFYVPRHPVAWPRGAHARIAGVSSFGIGGTNAHVILEEAPVAESPAPLTNEFILPLSARHPDALRKLAAYWCELLASGREQLADLCSTAALRRTPHAHRLAVTGTDSRQLADLLGVFLRGEVMPGLSSGTRPSDRRRRIAFVFGGQGGQWLGMGRELMVREPVFAESLNACAKALREHMSDGLLDTLSASTESARFHEIDFVQPAVFAIQVSLAALWRSWGIQPDAVLGQSMGEVAAAHVAGALSLPDAARVIARRSFLARRLVGMGAMAVTELSLEEARDELKTYAGRLAVAVSSSPRSTVLSGDIPAIEEIVQKLESRGVFCRMVKVDIASHSPQVDVLRDDLLRELAPVSPRPGPVPFYSTVTAQQADGGTLDAGYWVRNFREPVLLADTVDRMLGDGFDTFLEIGPHPVVMPSIVESAQHAGRDASVLASTRRDKGERSSLLESVAALYCLGFDVDWRKLYPIAGRHVTLPAYPWQRERFWLDRHVREVRAGGVHPLLNREFESSLHASERIWESDSNAPGLAYALQHRVDGAALFPAAGYLEAALSAGARLFGTADVALEDVSFDAALPLIESEPVRIQFAATMEGPARAAFRVSSHSVRDGGNQWTVHATGKIRTHARPAAGTQDVDAIRGQLSHAVSHDEHYRLTAAHKIDYGPLFQCLDGVQRGDGEALGQLRRIPAGGHVIHPAALDACLQVLGHAVSQASGFGIAVPVGVGRLWVTGMPVYARATLSASDNREFTGELQLLDAAGNVVGEVGGLRIRAIAEDSNRYARLDWLYELNWIEAPLRAGFPSGPPRKWLIVAGPDQSGMAARLNGLLQAGGHESSVSDQVEDRNPCGAVVYLAGQDDANLLQVVQSLARSGYRDAPRLYLVTRGARSIDPADATTAPLHAPVWGISRTIAIEHPEFRCCTIDLDPDSPPDDAAALAAELLPDDSEPAVALRGGKRYVERLNRWSPPAPSRVSAGGRAFRLEITRPGILDTLEFRELLPRAPGRREVQIRVIAAGINFADTLKALGTYPSREAGSDLLGGECSGVVMAVGEGVSSFQPGDEVIAVAAGSFGTLVTAGIEQVWRKPLSIGFKAAAGLPIAAATAWYSLRSLAHLSHGERVLIHSAAGGVGLAAVEIALALGAEVYATAGTPEKRAYLQTKGVRKAMDSRALDFAAELLRETGGLGVDVVLNSLSGEALHRSLEVLGPHGRFVEIGKRDIYADTHVGLLSFRRNQAYFAVDLAALIAERPAVFRAVMDEVLDFFGSGQHPLPHRVFPIARIGDALHELAQGKHIGKLVASLADAAQVQIVPAPTEAQLRADATYLITGGLGGLGLALLRWMTKLGVKNVVLAGRRGPSPAAEAALERARDAGVRIEAVPVDVSNAGDMNGLMGELSARWPPLGGVIHAAGVLDDGILLRLDRERFCSVMAPKAAGAWNLHTATLGIPLDFFVMFSSTSAVLGSPGQANHSAANAFLDALAHFRRAQRLPAVSINWGPWSEVGKAAGWRGAGMISPDAGVEILGRLLNGPAQISVIPFDLRQWREAFPAASNSKLFEHLIQTERDRGVRLNSALADTLRAAPPAERLPIIEAHVAEQLGRVLRLAPAQIERETSVSFQGLDSLMALELRNRLELSFGLKLRATLIWSYPTVAGLSRFLAERLGFAEVVEVITPVETELASLTDEEASALLIKELAGMEKRAAQLA